MNHRCAPACMVIALALSGHVFAATRVPAPVANATVKAAAAAAPQPAVQVAPLSVEQIAQRNAAARGGLAGWQRIDAMTLSGKLDAGRTRRDGGRVGMATSTQGRAEAKALARKTFAATGTVDGGTVIQLPFQLDLKRPAMTRLEIPFKGESAVQVYDGTNGWKLRPYLGRREVEPYNSTELKLAASQQQLDGALINYAAKGTRVALGGAELVEGHAAYKLTLTLKTGEVRHLWIDAQTFLDLKIDSAPRQWDGKLRQVSTYFRDYKPVQGLLIAHRLETTVDGVRGSENIYVNQVALNPALPDDRFARPQ